MQTPEETRPMLSFRTASFAVRNLLSLAAYQLPAKSRFLRFAFGMTTHFLGLDVWLTARDGVSEIRDLSKQRGNSYSLGPDSGMASNCRLFRSASETCSAL